MIRDDMNEDLAELRRQDELAARRVLREMALSPETPATARATAARALLADATTRRHDPDLDAKQMHEMSQAELSLAIEATARRLAIMRAEPIDADFEIVAPAGSVFD